MSVDTNTERDPWPIAGNGGERLARTTLILLSAEAGEGAIACFVRPWRPKQLHAHSTCARVAARSPSTRAQ
eukprot:3852165-Lingulodinium_polyedra.AAC.1